MDERTKMKLEKILDKFTESDFLEALLMISEKKKVFRQKQIEIKEKEAAHFLFDNIEYLLENKNNLAPEFVKKIEALQGHSNRPSGAKKRGRKKKDSKTNNSIT